MTGCSRRFHSFDHHRRRFFVGVRGRRVEVRIEDQWLAFQRLAAELRDEVFSRVCHRPFYLRLSIARARARRSFREIDIL